jgi:DNA-directed RNA polymerase specialized sigma24 family protein
LETAWKDERYVPWVSAALEAGRRAALVLTRDEESAEECAQQALISSLRAHGPAHFVAAARPPEGSTAADAAARGFAAYVARAAVNAARRRRGRSVVAATVMSIHVENFAEPVDDQQLTPDAILSAAEPDEDASAVRHCLSRLRESRPEHWQLLQWRHVEGLNWEVIAGKVGRPLSTTFVAAGKALTWLRDCVQRSLASPVAAAAAR